MIMVDRFNFAAQQRVDKEFGKVKSPSDGLLAAGVETVLSAPVTLPYAAATTVAGSVENITSNTVGRGIKFFDTDIFNEENDKRRLNKLADLTGLGYAEMVADNFDKNYQGIKTTADIATLFLGVNTISKGTQGVGALSKLGTTNTGRKLFGDFTRVEKAFDDFHTISKEIATKDLGVVTGAVDTQRKLENARKTIRSSQFNLLPTKARGPLGASVKEAASTEVAIAALMNDSEFFFPEGMNNWDYAQMAGFGLGLPLGIDKLRSVARIKKTVQTVGEKEVRSVREGLGLTADAVTDDEILMLSGVRHNNVQGRLDDEINVTDNLKSNVATLTDTNRETQRRAITRLADREDDLGAIRTQLTGDEVDTAIRSVNARPENFLGVHSIEKVGEVQPVEMTFKIENVGLPKIRKRISELFAAPNKSVKQNLELQTLKQQRSLLKNTEIKGIAQDGTTFDRKLPDGFDSQSTQVKINKNGKFSLGKDFNRLGSKDRHLRVTTAYAKMGGQVDSFAKGLDDKRLKQFLESAADTTRNYVEDDFAAEVLKRYAQNNGKEAVGKILNSSERLKKLDVQGVDDYVERIQSRSFRKKAKALADGNRTGAFQDFEPLDLSRHFNLKLHTLESNMPTNLGLYLEQRGANISKLTGESLRNDYRQFAQSLSNDALEDVDDVLTFAGDNLNLKGKPLAIQRDRRKQEINVQHARDLARVADETQNSLLNRLVVNGQTIDGALRNVSAPNLINIALGETADEFSQAFSRDVQNIFAGADRTANNDTLGGKIVGQILPQDKNFKNFFVDAFQYAAQINKGITNKYEQAAKDYLKTNERVFGEIRKKDNFADLTSLNVTVRSFNQGWDIAKGSSFKVGELRMADTISNRDKLRGFGLNDQTIDNVFKNGNDAEIPDITRLAQGTYQPVGITDLASQALEVLREADQVTKINRNGVRAANNVQVVDDELLSLPNMMNKYEQTVIVHEVGTNKIVTLSGGKDLDKALENAEQFINSARKGRKASEPVLIAKPAVQFKAETGQTPFQQGFDVGKVDTALVPSDAGGVLDVMLKSIIRDWGSVSTDVINSRFKKEINFLEHMESSLRSADGAVRKGQSRNVYSEVKNRLLGIDTGRPQGLAYSKLLNSADAMGDAVFAETAKQLDPFFARVFDKQAKTSKALDDIGRATGYKPAEEFLKVNGLNVDASSEGLARRMNAVAGFWVLRFMELGQSILNISTIPTILPTVGKTLSRRPNETFDEYRGRVGAFANVLGDNTPATMNPVKIMQAGIHDMFTDAGRKVYQEGKRLGNLDASVVETHDIIFEGGRRYADPSNWQKFKNVAVTPTDFTEQYSRTVSYMAGYRLFKEEAGDTLSDAALHKLANWFADQNVGDYSKVTRPDQFKGGVGSALGLFQTFFTNYWQRFARAIESGDNKTIATQFGTQGVVFGVESIPGYDSFEKAWSSYDGSQTPWESLVGAYGVDYAEILGTGALSNLPKLFGAKDGIALHTRGDTNVRGIPNITEIDNVPAVTLARKLIKGVGATVNLVKQEGTNTSSGRLLEIAASMSPSRSVKGALEIINGRSVDRNGGLVTDETRELGNAVSRLIGSKPLAEQRAGAMMYRQRGMQQIANARMSIMRNNFVSKVRDEGMSKELVNEMLERYIDEHRNPATFKQWLKELNKKAKYSKSHREMLRTYKRMAKGQTSKYADKQTLRFYQLIASDPTTATEFAR